MVITKMKCKTKNGFTFVELLIATVIIVIVWLMLSGIMFFLFDNTLIIINKDDRGMLAVSSLDHLERNISSGIAWSRHENDDKTMLDIDVFIPDPINHDDRTQDRKIRYRFIYIESGEGKVIYFYPDVTSMTEGNRWIALYPREKIVSNIENFYISDVDPNAREIYIGLETAPSEFKYATENRKFCKTIRLRSLW